MQLLDIWNVFKYGKSPTENGTEPCNFLVFKFSFVTWPFAQTTPVHGVSHMDSTGMNPSQFQPFFKPDLIESECAKLHIAAVSASTLGENVGDAVGFSVGTPVGNAVGAEVGLPDGLPDGRPVGPVLGCPLGSPLGHPDG